MMRACLAALALGMCGSRPVDAQSATAIATPAIEGPEWSLTELRGQPAKALAALRPPITVRFADNRLQVFAGCNQMMGGYVVEQDRVRFDALAGTMMACAPPVMAVEDAFKAALSGVLVYRVAGDRLTLAAPGDTQPSMTFRAVPPPQFDGISWLVSGYNNGRQAVVSPLPGTALTLEFRAGVITGHAGCNTFRGPYTRAGTRLSVGPLTPTRKHCAGDVMEQEHAFLAALQATDVWAIDRGMLDLHGANGERVLTAHRADSH